MTKVTAAFRSFANGSTNHRFTDLEMGVIKDSKDERKRNAYIGCKVSI